MTLNKLIKSSGKSNPRLIFVSLSILRTAKTESNTFYKHEYE